MVGEATAFASPGANGPSPGGNGTAGSKGTPGGNGTGISLSGTGFAGGEGGGGS